eukprot:g72458.t1
MRFNLRNTLTEPLLAYRVVSYRIVSYRIISYRIVSYRIVSYRTVSYRIVSYCLVSSRLVFYRIVSYPYRIESYRIVSNRIESYRIVSNRIVSYRIVLYRIRIVAYPIVSYRIVPYRIVSYHIVSYHIVSYRIVSYRIVSYRIEEPFALGPMDSLRLLLDRQARLLLRDKEVLYGKLMVALFVGLLLGAVFYNAPPLVYMRMLFFSLAIFQRRAWQQIAIFIAARPVFRKQEGARFFRFQRTHRIFRLPTREYGGVVHPWRVLLFPGSPNAHCRLVLHLLFHHLFFQNAIGAYFTFLASISANATIAQARSGVSVCFFLLFRCVSKEMEREGTYVLYVGVLVLAVLGLMFVFVAMTCGNIIAADLIPSRLTEAQREAYLARFQISQGREFIWVGIAVLCFYYVLFYSLTTAALHYLRFDGSRWNHIPEPYAASHDVGDGGGGGGDEDDGMSQQQ